VSKLICIHCSAQCPVESEGLNSHVCFTRPCFMQDLLLGS